MDIRLLAKAPLRDAILAGLSPSERSEMHAAAASAIQTAAPGAASLRVVFDHWLAGNLDRAEITVTALAAVAHARQTLDHAGERHVLAAIARDARFADRTRLDALYDLCKLSAAAAEFGAQLHWSGRALRLAARLHDHEIHFSVLQKAAGLALHFGDSARAMRHLRRAKKLMNYPETRRFHAGYMLNLANVHGDLGELDKQRECLQAAARLAKDSGNLIMAVSAQANLAGLLCHTGDLQDAAAEYNDCLDITKLVARPDIEASVLSNLGYLHRRMGKLSKAEEYFRQSGAIYQQIGDTTHLAEHWNHLATVASDRGDVKLAIEFNRKSIALHREAQSHEGVIVPLCNLAINLADIGDLSGARAVMHEAELEASRDIPVEDRYVYLEAIARIREREGNLDEALKQNEFARCMLREDTHELFIGYSLVDRASMLMQRGNHAEAKEAALRAQEILSRAGVEESPVYLTNLSVLVGSLSAMGESGMATFVAEDARSVVAKLKESEYGGTGFSNAIGRLEAAMSAGPEQRAAS
ncbi:MAG: tetratricopeptide repeat protein [Planctomycetes bacterium]|nr:tetratricopeptide repeat protein [Planctomycetota bacterium]MCB9935482.1 tetratricopeptide repeat protein [Planctomycetota bacterium]